VGATKRTARQNWFWDDNAIFDMGLSPAAMLVRFYLCRCADSSTSQAYPTVNTIAAKCGLSRSTVYEALKELEQKNLIIRESRTNGNGGATSNLYTILPAVVDSADVVNVGSSDEIRATSQIGDSVSTSGECIGSRYEGCPPGRHKQYSLNKIDDHDDPHSPPLDDPAISAAKYWSQISACPVGSLVVDKLATYFDDGMTLELMIDLMKECGEKNKLRLDYLYAMANNCVRVGIFTVEARLAAKARYEAEKAEMAVRRSVAKKKEAQSIYTMDDYRRALDEALGVEAGEPDAATGSGSSDAATGEHI
jgi:hypothetical protein